MATNPLLDKWRNQEQQRRDSMRQAALADAANPRATAVIPDFEGAGNTNPEDYVPYGPLSGRPEYPQEPNATDAPEPQDPDTIQFDNGLPSNADIDRLYNKVRQAPRQAPSGRAFSGRSLSNQDIDSIYRGLQRKQSPGPARPVDNTVRPASTSAATDQIPDTAPELISDVPQSQSRRDPNSFPAPEDTEGNPETLGEVVGNVAQFPRNYARAIGLGIRSFRGGVSDVAERVAGFQGSDKGNSWRNLSAAFNEEPLPIDETLAQPGVSGILDKVSKMGLDLIPRLYLMRGLGAAGMGPATSGAAAFGVTEEGNADPAGAILGALMPGLSEVGRTVADAGTQVLIDKGLLSATNKFSRNLASEVGAVASIQTLNTALQTPELAALYARDPKAFWQKIAADTTASMAFVIGSAPEWASSPGPWSDAFRTTIEKTYTPDQLKGIMAKVNAHAAERAAAEAGQRPMDPKVSVPTTDEQDIARFVAKNVGAIRSGGVSVSRSEPWIKSPFWQRFLNIAGPEVRMSVIEQERTDNANQEQSPVEETGGDQTQGVPPNVPGPPRQLPALAGTGEGSAPAPAPEPVPPGTEQTHESGAKFVMVPRKDGTLRRQWVQTQFGRRVGDVYNEGMPDRVISSKDDHTPGIDSEYVKVTVHEILGPRDIEIRHQDMTPEEIEAKQEKLRRDNEVRKEMGLPEEPIPDAPKKSNIKPLPPEVHKALEAAEALAKAGDHDHAEYALDLAADQMSKFIVPITSGTDASVIHQQNAWTEEYQKREAAVLGQRRKGPTAEDLLKKKPADITHEDIEKIPAAEMAKVFAARKPDGELAVIPQFHSVLAGMKLDAKSLDKIHQLAEDAKKRMMSALGRNDHEAFMGEQGKNLWFAGMIEGINRKGPNFTAAMNRVSAAALASMKSEPVAMANGLPVYEGAEARRELTDRFGLPQASEHPGTKGHLVFVDPELGTPLAYFSQRAELTPAQLKEYQDAFNKREWASLKAGKTAGDVERARYDQVKGHQMEALEAAAREASAAQNAAGRYLDGLRAKFGLAPGTHPPGLLKAPEPPKEPLEQAVEDAQKSPEQFMAEHPGEDRDKLALDYQKAINTAIAMKQPVFADWVEKIKDVHGKIVARTLVANGWVRQGDHYVWSEEEALKRQVMGPPKDATPMEMVSALRKRLVELAPHFQKRGLGHMTGTWFDAGVVDAHNVYIAGRGITLTVNLKELIAKGDKANFLISGLPEDANSDSNKLPANVPDQEILAILDSQSNAQQKSASLRKLAEQRGISVKDMQELVELEIVRRTDWIARHQDLTPEGKFYRIVGEYGAQPTLGARTSTSIDNQAYSTPPPLGYALGFMTGLTPDEAVYDATAGNAMLMIGGNFATSWANEINPVRLANLRKLGIGTVTNFDATGFTPNRKFKVIHLNPPFGSIANVNYQGYGIKKLEHLIVLKALEALDSDGRAAIVLGANMNEGNTVKGAQWVFENYLYGHFNVVANFEVSGDLYAKQGAKWPVRVIVIVGRRKNPVVAPEDLAPKSVARHTTWAQVWEEAVKTRNATDAIRPNLVPPTGGGLPLPLPPGGGTTGEQGGPPGAPSPTPPTAPNGGNGGGGSPGQPPVGDQPPGGGPGVPPGQPPGGPNGPGTPPQQPGGPGEPPTDVEGGDEGGTSPTPPTGGGGAPTGKGPKSGSVSGKGGLGGKKAGDLGDLTDKDIDDLLDEGFGGGEPTGENKPARRKNLWNIKTPSGKKKVVDIDPEIHEVINGELFEKESGKRLGKVLSKVEEKETPKLAAPTLFAAGERSASDNYQIWVRERDGLWQVKAVVTLGGKTAVSSWAGKYKTKEAAGNWVHLKVWNALADRFQTKVSQDQFNKIFEGGRPSERENLRIEAERQTRKYLSQSSGPGQRNKEDRYVLRNGDEMHTDDLGNLDWSSYEPKAPPAGPREKTAEEIAAELAKVGIKGADNAIKGLHQLFGGGATLGSGGPGFDERSYAKAKPYFEQMWKDFKKAGGLLLDFVKHIAKQFGDAIKPYLRRFLIDVREEEKNPKPPEPPKPPQQPPKLEATEYQVPYVPRSQATPMGLLIPKSIGNAVHTFLDKLQEKVGPLDDFVMDRLQMTREELYRVLSSEQIDSVAMAIYQVENGGALIIGDETGIGKGRQAAALIRYALMRGWIPVFFTKDPKLFSDMWGDLKDIGTEIKPFIMGDVLKGTIVDPLGNVIHKSPAKPEQDRIMQRILEKGFEKSGFNVILATYSQINTRNARQLFLEQLGDQNPIMLVMDEAHEAAGDGTSSMQAAFFSGNTVIRGSGPNQEQIVVPGLLNANGLKHGMGGVLYLSATYAKRPENMPVYFRTDLSKAAQSFDEIVNAMKRGGVALQQAVSEGLAQVGQYVRRERDFTGVSYDMEKVEVADQAKLEEQVDAVTDVLSQIVDFSERIRDAMARAQGGGQSTAMSQNSIDMTDFAAIVHNQLSQLLLAAKADTVVAKCIEAKKRGEKPLVALMNTMESFLDHYVEDRNIKVGQSLQLRWNELIEHALSRTLRAKEKLPDGSTNIFIVDPDEFGLGELYRSIQEAARAIDAPFTVSPIDYIIQKLNAAGVKMAELTGRESGITYDDFEKGVGKYTHFKKANKNEVVNGFNSGTYDGMLLNASGSTGLSAHASEKFKDQRPRHMLIAQAALDINVFMQTLGRIRRTGMVKLGKNVVAKFPPQYYGKFGKNYKGDLGKNYQGLLKSETTYGARYTHLVLPLQAELRPAAMTSRKMKSLNANTTADADNAIKIDSEDFFNKYGDAVVADYLDQHDHLQSMLGLWISVKDDGTLEVPRDLARRFTGRMALLPNADQKAAYEAILPAYRQRLEQLKATGEYDLEIVVHDDWDGLLRDDQQLSAGTDDSVIFTSGTRLQKWDIRDMRHVPTGAEMVKEFKTKLGSVAKIEEQWEKVREAANAKFNAMQAEIDRLQQKYDLDEARVATMTPQEKEGHAMANQQLTFRRAQLQGAQNRWARARDMADHVIPDAGSVVDITNAETGDTYRGMLVEIRFPTNRFNLSAFRFKFLLHEPGGVAFIGGTQIGPTAWSMQASSSEPKDLGPGDKNARYDRFVVVGNPISAYRSTGGRGKMTRFKSQDHKVITGLLMPRNWGPQQLANDPRLDLVNGRAAAHFMVTHGSQNFGRTQIPIECANVVRISRDGYGVDEWTVATAASRRTGGPIYLDQAIRDITGDFVKRGQRMVASVSGERDLTRVIDRIMKVTSNRFRPVGNPTALMPLVQNSNQQAGGGQSSIEPLETIQHSENSLARAQGVAAIRKMMQDPNTGLSPEARRVALALLDEPVMRDLDWSRLRVALSNGLSGGASGRAWVGFQLMELARGANPATFPHEVFHFLWELLPPEVREEINGYRVEELHQALMKLQGMENLPEEVGQFIGQMLTGHGLTSEDYLAKVADLSARYPQVGGLLRRWYYLSSPQEYLSGMAGKQYSEDFFHKEAGLFERMLAKVKAWLAGLLAALKRVIGSKPGIKAVINELLAGKYRSTPASGTEFERGAQADPTPPAVPQDDGTNLGDLELDDDQAKTTQRMGVIDKILGRQSLTPQMLAAGKAHAMAQFAKAGLQMTEAQDGYAELLDPDFEAEIEGQRLLDLVRTDIAHQQQEGETAKTGALYYLLNSIRLHMIDDDVGAFSETLKTELYAVTQGEASHRGLNLGVLAALPKTVAYVARNAKTYLSRTYSDAFGGDFVRKILARIATDFRSYFTEEEIDAVLRAHPIIIDFLDRVAALDRRESGHAVYRKVQYLLKEKKRKTLGKLQADARVQEAVNEILQQAKTQGIEPIPSPNKPLSPLDQLVHLVNPANSEKINALIEQAIADASREAGTKLALSEAKTQEERDDLLENFHSGGGPTDDQMERGLDQPEFAHWKVIRDNLLGYNPVTLRLTQNLIRSDFKGTRFGQPVARPEDTRIDLVALAKEPAAEVERVLDAYLANIEANLDIGQAGEATKNRVVSLIETELQKQLESARERVRAPMFAEPAKRGVPLSPEARLAQILNAGLFADPKLDLVEMITRVAKKSRIQKLLPKAGDLVKMALGTPTYKQAGFAQAFSMRMAQLFNLPMDQLGRAEAVFMTAFQGAFEAARQKAIAKATGALTPAERRVWKPGKPIYDKVVQAVNAGSFDSVDALEAIARAHGWTVPTEATLKRFRDLANRLQKLQELTPEELAEAGNDPEALKRAQVSRDATTLEKRAQVAKEIGSLWATMTKPISWTHPIATRHNIAAAMNEFEVANVLLKLGFAIRLPIHVGMQFVVHVGTRAPAIAWERARSGDRTGLWKDIAHTLGASISASFAAMRPALSAFKAAMGGRGEARNVDRLVTGINAFERMNAKADQLAAQGKHAQAFILRFAGLAKFSLRFVQAVDNFQGTMAEYNELTHEIENGLRAMGMSNAEILVNRDRVIGSLKDKHVAAMAMARHLFELSGEPFTEAELRDAAWDLVKANVYEDIRAMGMPADDIQAGNNRLRRMIAWQERVTTGPGGVVAGFGRGLKALAGSLGLPFPFALFANAVGTGINYSLMNTPLYALANARLPGSEPSPWFATERERLARRSQALFGSMIGSLAVALILAGVIRVVLKGPEDKEERELWEAQGHRAGTLEIVLNDLEFIPMSLTVGPGALIAPFAAAAGALVNLVHSREKAQAKLNKEAEKLGLPPGEIRPVSSIDVLGVAAEAFWGILVSSKALTGVVQSTTEYGVPNIVKTAAAFTSPTALGLPAYQEVTRMMGVNLDSKLAGFWDFLLPNPWSKARAVNLLGDPVRTPDDVQRVIQTLTSGSYPGVVDSGKARDVTAYAALLNSGYRPPSIEVGQGYDMGGTYRPMNNAELNQFAVARGQEFKEALNGVGAEADLSMAKSAFQQAKEAALLTVGANPVAPQHASSGEVPESSATRFVPPGLTPAPTPAAMGGAPTPRTRGTARPTRSLRRGIRRVVTRPRGPSLRRRGVIQTPLRRTGTESGRSLRPRH